MRSAPSVTALVTRARVGDKQAWEELVERYVPLVWSICRQHWLGAAHAEDVGQNVWLRLVEHLDNLRDPAALPGWLATTTRRECYRVLRSEHTLGTVIGIAGQDISDDQAVPAEQELLLAERRAALREAFAHLPPRHQQVLALLIQDPPVPYARISATLGIPVGAIGPLRSRCLHRLRAHPAIAALIDAEAARPPIPVAPTHV